MKRLMKAVAATLILAVAAASGAQRVAVRIDGNPVYFPNAQAQYVNGRVLVPLRGVFEQMGAKVNWNNYTQTVTASNQQSRVQVTIGDHTAMVNGNPVTIDVPPMIIDGSTMVPVRFVSEALGAQVGWNDSMQLVSIDTMTAQGTAIVTPPHYLRRVTLREDEVIPVTLNQTLSSVDNRKGDTFSATIQPRDSRGYGGLPHGTKIEGHVAAAHPRRANRPGILDLSFDRIRFPDGKTSRIEGTLISLDDKHVNTGDDGILTARRSGNSDQRMVYAGYGAGAGLLVGVLTKRPLETTILGGALGYILGQVKHDEQQRTSNVTLRPGTTMGVRIDRDLATNW